MAHTTMPKAIAASSVCTMVQEAVEGGADMDLFRRWPWLAAVVVVVVVVVRPLRAEVAAAAVGSVPTRAVVSDVGFADRAMLRGISHGSRDGGRPGDGCTAPEGIHDASEGQRGLCVNLAYTTNDGLCLLAARPATPEQDWL